jgi:hypothetical protein
VAFGLASVLGFQGQSAVDHDAADENADHQVEHAVPEDPELLSEDEAEEPADEDEEEGVSD